MAQSSGPGNDDVPRKLQQIDTSEFDDFADSFDDDENVLLSRQDNGNTILKRPKNVSFIAPKEDDTGLYLDDEDDPKGAFTHLQDCVIALVSRIFEAVVLGFLVLPSSCALWIIVHAEQYTELTYKSPAQIKEEKEAAERDETPKSKSKGLIDAPKGAIVPFLFVGAILYAALFYLWWSMSLIMASTLWPVMFTMVLVGGLFAGPNVGIGIGYQFLGVYVGMLWLFFVARRTNHTKKLKAIAPSKIPMDCASCGYFMAIVIQGVTLAAIPFLPHSKLAVAANEVAPMLQYALFVTNGKLSGHSLTGLGVVTIIAVVVMGLKTRDICARCVWGDIKRWQTQIANRTFFHPPGALAGFFAVFCDGMYPSLVVAAHYSLYCSDTAGMSACFEADVATDGFSYKTQAMIGMYVGGIYFLSSAMVTGMFLRPKKDSSLVIEYSQYHSVLEKLAFLTIGSIGLVSGWNMLAVNIVSVLGCIMLICNILSKATCHTTSNLARAVKVWAYLTGIIFGLLGVIADVAALEHVTANILSVVCLSLSALLMVFCCSQCCCLKWRGRLIRPGDVEEEEEEQAVEAELKVLEAF